MERTSPIPKNRTTVSVLALALAVVPLVGCVAPGDVDVSSHDRILDHARGLAEDLDTPEEAFAAGYRPDEYCIPGMGVHWIHKPGENDSYLDTTLDPAYPEALMFLPDTSDLEDTSGDKFLGIEYVVVTEGTDMNSTENVPDLFGVTFDGPMAGHGPGMPWHVDLHVYLADGMESTDDFPSALPEDIVCPEGTTPPASPHEAIMRHAAKVAEDLDTPEEAFAAGYRPDPFCIPGMGVHWIHKPGEDDSYFDANLDPDHPEALMFLPDDSDTSNTTGDKFLGIEYLVVTEGMETNSTETAPRFMGVPMEGPMPGHAPGMPWHVDFHVYLADGLESGATFPAAQPEKIVCPDGTTPPQDPHEGHDH